MTTDGEGRPKGARGWKRAALATALGTVAVTVEANAAPSAETAFVLNTFSFLIWGALVMWMCAGFTMLEAGSVRTKNASMICLKNVGLYSIAGLAYYVIGYNLMYTDVGNIIGTFSFFHGSSAAEIALLNGAEDQAAVVAGSGYSTMSNWFFQMVFVATAASIVSGTIAERVQLWAFFAFTLVLTAFIYPVVGAWTWGEGWLFGLGFKDFAGSTIVHSTGGWAALAGALVVGPWFGKDRADGTVKPTPPSNVPAVTLGVFILWLGWFGFNGGSQLALAGVLDAVAMSNVLVNTNLAAAAGAMAAIALSRPILGRIDLLAGLNGAIAGLVSITAGPDMTRPLLGNPDRRGWRRPVHCWHKIPGVDQSRRRGRRSSRAPVRRHLGNPGGVHRFGRRLRRPDYPDPGRWRVRVHVIVGAVVRAGQADGRPGFEKRRGTRPGRVGTRHRGVSGIRGHARPGRGRRIRA